MSALTSTVESPDLRARASGARGRERRVFARGPGLRALAAGVALLVLTTGAHAEDTAEPLWTDAAPGPAAGLPGSLAELASDLTRSTVRISVTSARVGRRGRPESPIDHGSGFVVNERGLILTADSVVRDASRIRVELASGRNLPGRIVGRDFGTGLALLEIDAGAERLAPLPFARADEVRVGDWAATLGHTDEGAATFSKGIIAARDRWLPGEVTGGPPGFGRYLQLDMGTIVGFAGAPLVDMNGRLIGIVSSSSETEGSSIGFAIPIETAKQVLPQLASEGRVTRGWLGVRINRVTPEIAASFALADTTGALVEDVYDDSPAARASIEKGDVVVEFDGTPIRVFRELSQCVGVTTPGSEVDLVVLRGGERRTLHARIDPRDADPGVSAGGLGLGSGGRISVDDISFAWGFDFAALDSDLRARFSFDADETGFVVSRVEPGSPAQRAGLQLGDLLRDIGRAPISSEEQLRDALDQSSVVLRIRRGRASRYLVLTP